MNPAELLQLGESFTQFYYGNFQQQATRVNVISAYVASCQASYNGKTYQGHEGLEQLFTQRFEIGDVQIIPTSVNAVMAGDAVLVSVLGKMFGQNPCIFSEVFLLVNDGQGNFSIMSDIFSIDPQVNFPQQQPMGMQAVQEGPM